MMGFHALRRTVGDENFRMFLARFYRDFKGSVPRSTTCAGRWRQ